MLVFILLLVVVYMLGNQWGRESPSRNKQQQDITTKKAELKNLESQLSSSTTSPFLHLLILFGVLFLLGIVFGGGRSGNWDDGERSWSRSRRFP